MAYPQRLAVCAALALSVWADRPRQQANESDIDVDTGVAAALVQGTDDSAGGLQYPFGGWLAAFVLASSAQAAPFGTSPASHRILTRVSSGDYGRSISFMPNVRSTGLSTGIGDSSADDIEKYENAVVNEVEERISEGLSEMDEPLPRPEEFSEVRKKIVAGLSKHETVPLAVSINKKTGKVQFHVVDAADGSPPPSLVSQTTNIFGKVARQFQHISRELEKLATNETTWKKVVRWLAIGAQARTMIHNCRFVGSLFDFMSEISGSCLMQVMVDDEVLTSAKIWTIVQRALNKHADDAKARKASEASGSNGSGVPGTSP